MKSADRERKEQAHKHMNVIILLWQHSIKDSGVLFGFQQSNGSWSRLLKKINDFEYLGFNFSDILSLKKPQD